MNKYEITLTTPTIGKVKHVMRALNMDAAKARAQRAHPKGQIVAFAEVTA